MIELTDKLYELNSVNGKENETVFWLMEILGKLQQISRANAPPEKRFSSYNDNNKRACPKHYSSPHILLTANHFL